MPVIWHMFGEGAGFVGAPSKTQIVLMFLSSMALDDRRHPREYLRTVFLESSELAQIRRGLKAGLAHVLFRNEEIAVVTHRVGHFSVRRNRHLQTECIGRRISAYVAVGVPSGEAYQNLFDICDI